MRLRKVALVVLVATALSCKQDSPESTNATDNRYVGAWECERQLITTFSYLLKLSADGSYHHAVTAKSANLLYVEERGSWSESGDHVVLKPSECKVIDILTKNMKDSSCRDALKDLNLADGQLITAPDAGDFCKYTKK